jgi:hypothetical protein
MEQMTACKPLSPIRPALAEAFKRFVHRHYSAELHMIQLQSARLPEAAKMEYTRSSMDQLLLKILMDPQRRGELEVIFQMYADSSLPETCN